MSPRLEIVQGDITKMQVDCIVNAANTSLLGGGGVDGAIHRAAGPQLLEECRKIGGCPTGEARITKGYLLPARYVIHTVGPVWSGGQRGEENKLKSCYRNSLELARNYDIDTIAFPSISTGAYRYPLNEAAEAATEAISEYLSNNIKPLRVFMVCFDDKIAQAYRNAVEKLSNQKLI